MRASVVIVAYNAGEALTRCLESLDTEHETVVVNNGAAGPEIEAAARLPFVRVLSPGANIGFAGGANAGAREAGGDVLVFLNPDTVAAPGAVAALARRLEDRSIGIVMARLRLLDRPELLNSGGNELHISGIAWAGGYGKPADSVTEVREIPYASGTALAIRADVFRELGGFTEELFMYQEDLVLGWRARLRGLRVVVDPAADVYHDYDYGRNPDKHYLLERNRLVFCLSAYSGRTLGLLAPVLVVTEVAMLGLAAKDGWLGEKLRGWRWCAQNARWLLRHRRETQSLRRVPDRELAHLLTPVISPGMLTVPVAVRAANPLLAGYWALARRGL